MGSKKDLAGLEEDYHEKNSGDSKIEQSDADDIYFEEFSKAPYPDFTRQDARLNPRKYIGYRVFSRWLASDQNFFVVRRFGTLGARTVLYLQDAVTKCEEQLDKLDKQSSRLLESPGDPIDDGTFREDAVQQRRDLIEKDIPEALNRYYSFLNQYSQFVGRSKPDKGAIENVRKWFKGHSIGFTNDARLFAIDDQEKAYAYDPIHKDDLMFVQPKRKSPVRNGLEHTFLLNLKCVAKYFRRDRSNWGAIDPTDTPDVKENADGKGKRKKNVRRDEKWEGNNLSDLPTVEPPTFPEATPEFGYTVWANDKYIDRLAAILTALGGLVMLTGPLWILKYVDDINGRLVVITGFVCIFYILLSVGTTGSPSDAIAAVAAYSTVLTVFLTLGASPK